MTDNVVHIHFADAYTRRQQQIVTIFTIIQHTSRRDVYLAEKQAEALRDTGVISDEEFAAVLAHIRPFRAREPESPKRREWPKHVPFRGTLHRVLEPDDYEGPDAA